MNFRKLARIALIVVSLVFLLIPGFVFTLQGANVIRSRSFMTGDPLWIVIGVAMMLAGGALFYFSNRMPSAK